MGLVQTVIRLAGKKGKQVSDTALGESGESNETKEEEGNNNIETLKQIHALLTTVIHRRSCGDTGKSSNQLDDRMKSTRKRVASKEDHGGDVTLQDLHHTVTLALMPELVCP